MKRLLTLTLALLMLCTTLFTFVSCGNSDDVFVMATNATFPPYEYKEGREYLGIDIEIGKEIASRLGMKFKLKDVDFDSIIPGVQSGKYDAGLAGMTVTEERLKNISFSTPYANAVQVIIVPENSPYTTPESFYSAFDAEGNPSALADANLKIGVQKGTTGEIYASDELANWGFGADHVNVYKNGPEAVQDLKNGRIQAVIIDSEPAKAYVAQNAGLKILDASYADEEYAICVAKENTALLESINKVLADMKADGTLDRIISKYIK